MWSHVIVLLIGVWLMASPDLMNYEGPERTNNHVVGPLVASIALIAMAETTRPLRWINVLLGVWLLIAPVVLHYEPLHIGVRSSAIGLAIVGLSLLGGPRRDELGGGWSRIWGQRGSPQ